MIYRIASTSASPVGRAFATLVAMAMVVTFATSSALAQKPTPRPKPPAKQQPAAKKPAAQPQPQASASQPKQPPLIFKPWTKICGKGRNENAKEVCFTGKDGVIESGLPVVAAVLIEPTGAPKKVLRVTVPLGVMLQHGTRMFIDQDQPINKPYVTCLPSGCMSDYEATGDTVTKMKKGKGLTVQWINAAGKLNSVVLPLAEFAKAHDGPPTDLKAYAAQQQKMQQELQKRAEEARKKLEAQQPGKK